MKDVLSLCRHLPELAVPRGTTLIEEGVRADRLYVVKHGAFAIERGAVRLVVVREPGAFLGEMSAVLGSAPTATVVAVEDSAVHVLEHASTAVRTNPDLALAVARLLARRLAGVTAYLADIKRQYADSNMHLALMDEVLGNLVAANPANERTGSERPDVPDY